MHQTYSNFSLLIFFRAVPPRRPTQSGVCREWTLLRPHRNLRPAERPVTLVQGLALSPWIRWAARDRPRVTWSNKKTSSSSPTMSEVLRKLLASSGGYSILKEASILNYWWLEPIWIKGGSSVQHFCKELRWQIIKYPVPSLRTT